MSKEQHSYVGMWVTKDGYIRHELLPNNRYNESRGSKKTLIKVVTKFQAIISTISMILDLPHMVISKMKFFIMQE